MLASYLRTAPTPPRLRKPLFDCWTPGGVGSPSTPTFLKPAFCCAAPNELPLENDWKTGPPSGSGTLARVTTFPPPSSQTFLRQVDSQPNVAGPSMSKNPVAQGPRPQAPARHTAGACKGTGQACPQAPQLSASFSVSTGALAELQAVQTPLWHTLPPG